MDETAITAGSQAPSIARVRVMSGWVLFIFFVYPFLFENARMVDNSASQGSFRVSPLPRETRFVEMLAVLYTLLAVAHREKKLIRRDGAPLVGFLVLALFSSVLHGVSPGVLVGVQVLYAYLLFAVPLIIFDHEGASLEDLRRVMKVLLVAFVLNGLAGWVQSVGLGYWGDDVAGLLRDAHYFSTFMFFGLLIVGANLFLNPRWKWGYPLLLFGFLPLVIASNQKLYVLGPLSVIIFIILYRPRSLFKIIGVATLLGGGIYLLVTTLDTSFLDRVQLVRDIDFFALNPVAAYADMLEIFKNSPHTVITGVGLGNYADLVTFPSVATNVDFPIPPLFKTFVGESDEVKAMVAAGAFTWRTTFFVGLGVELGIVGCVLFLYVQCRLISRLVWVFRNNTNEVWRGMAAASAIAVIYLLVNSLTSISYTFESLALVWPLYGIAGLVSTQWIPPRGGH